MFYFIEPEVAGGLGENTIVDTTSHPSTVSALEYKFDGWLGDDILESFPCFIATQALAEKISKAQLSGYSFADVRITKSLEFDELHPNLSLPEFVWLKVGGIAGEDDFGIASDHRLVISDSTLKILKELQIENAVLEEFT